MTAAAVIPAPIAYIKVVAVKKLVVGSEVSVDEPLEGSLTDRNTIYLYEAIELKLKKGYELNRLSGISRGK